MTAITVRRSPSRALVMEHYHPMDVLDEIERFASDIWDSWTPVVYSTHMHPRLDLFENKDELGVRAELPGVKKEDIDVSREGDCLNIKAEKKQEEMSEETGYYTSERFFGDYSRFTG